MQEDLSGHPEDAMDFVLRSGASEQPSHRPPALEVTEVWGDLVMDVKHYPRGGRPVTVGTSTGTRWRYLGVPIAWVPSSFGRLAWLFGPTLSEATEEWKNEFYAPPQDLPHEDLALFQWNDGEWVFTFSGSWEGFADIGEERVTFRELIASGRVVREGDLYTLPVAGDTRVVADLGHVIFVGHLVEPGQKVVAKLTDQLDLPFLGVASLMAFLFALVAVIIVTSPEPPTVSFVEVPDRFSQMVLEQPEVEKPRPERPEHREGARAKEEEGKRGDKESKKRQGKGDRFKKRRQDREIAENSGLLGAMRDGAGLDGIFDSTELNPDIAGHIGGLIGSKRGQMGTGLGSRGSGFGGGSTAHGIGGLGTKGPGDGYEDYYASGGDIEPKKTTPRISIPQDTIVLGALDRALVDEVVKRHMSQVRYCYQRELNRTPGLSGKLTVKFVISRTGAVSKARVKSSSLANERVESCVTDRFMRFRFPEPQGGGVVIVSYPFIFSSNG